MTKKTQKSTSHYLLEIGCEEIPSRFIPGLLSDLSTRISQALTTARIDFSEISTLGTYRRLTIIISGISNTQKDHQEDIIGPPANIALDANGNPLPPAIGFAKKSNIDVDQLKIITKNGQTYIGFTKNEKGSLTIKVLPQLVTDIIKNLPLPIAMRWGSHTDTFIRPIHWIVSLFNDKVVPLTLFDITAGRISYGHRLLTDNPSKKDLISGEKITLKRATDYEMTLRKSKVMVNQNDRRSLILDELKRHMSDVTIDQETLDEVTYLVEWPTLIQGHFNKEYLTIPKQALIQCIKKHQKYFPLIQNNTLTHEFWVVADNITSHNKDIIIKGNQNVLTARLEDVKFFWEEDLKVTLDDLTPKLATIVFQKGLGSIQDKVNRVSKLANHIAQDIGASAHIADIQRTITLAKADLVSHMVGELPELQGLMGAVYAKYQGESDLVCQGIQEHYMPKSASDGIPKSITGTVVALADKLDTTVASFHNNLIPTGSQDPWSIRRGVYGIAKILVDGELNVSLTPWINEAYLNLESRKNDDKLLAFISQRFHSFLEERGLSQDSVQASLSTHGLHLLNAQKTAKDIDYFRKKSPGAFKSLVETAVRISRLAKNIAPNQPITESLFELAEEKNSYKVFQALPKEATLADLSSLTKSMTEYFEKVLVMDKNPDIKTNRLRFLATLAHRYGQLANFEKIII